MMTAAVVWLARRRCGASLLVLVLVASAVAAASDSATAGNKHIDVVDPFIGTGNFGFGVGGDPVGVQVPFGCVRLSPDGSDGHVWLDFLHYGGYHYSDTSIRCFSHTHMVGPGVADLGNIGVMATQEVPSAFLDRYWYRAPFSHANERATPYEYAVNLTSGINVTLTACGTHAAKQIYRFSSSSASASASSSSSSSSSSLSRRANFVVFDIGHSLSSNGKAVIASNVSVTVHKNTQTTQVEGYAVNRGSLTGRNGGVGVPVYFTALINAIPTDTATWDSNSTAPAPAWSSLHLDGVRVGAILQFDNPDIEITSAISFVSLHQARVNFGAQTENGTAPYSTCKQATHTAWKDALAVVEVHDANPNASTYTQFYTALYHSFMAPTRWSEAGGVYLGMDGRVRTSPPAAHRYTDMSIWDIHRTQVPLLDLLRPDVSADIARSLVGMYEEGGDIPRWPIANVYAGCMIATHANIMLAGMIAKNITGFNVTAAYEGMRLQATDPSRPHIGREGLQDYITLGYVPFDSHGKAASLTLAYAYDDWALASVASHLGHTQDAVLFLNRSRNYVNVWDEESMYMCPRMKTGSFKCNPVPSFHEWIVQDSGFCEGNQAEWRWFVPHDLDGLISLFGKQRYVEELSTFFDKTWSDPSTTLPNPHYWAGNEPDILEPFQFHAAGRADLSQLNSRRVMNFAYSSRPGGLPGNDDYGTLSAWYVWAAVGLYPLAGTDLYFIGSPVFEHVTLHLPGGHSLDIHAHNTSATNVYVQSIQLDGAAIDPFYANVTHHRLTAASALVLTMADTPPAPSS
ncbi:hypothetical protein PTSG_10430 [Salpingoeca rosetta]|uniref:Alpha-1,2-mannosidase n=1 Tax=Salpingoeca rosetta (strain ATCC 50818 / BSB-021) TaxID=946362 RepID=F2UPM6_SALR5|nr:uncharacterized protein PTSG_10430 [Salpingoeca rosetta]EGD79581.1 hypothetical protein PTSG_10430 [Salpingoeca rosetta]|eukprot:XP_004988809.1 hypothetical protein PTSG_10430 [Salpingoeca rosetta]